MLSNYAAGEDSWKSLGQQGDQRKLTLNIHWKDWCSSWSSSPLATWCEDLTHWKRPICRGRLRAGGEGGDPGWHGWMASATQWTWVWASSGSWWQTGKLGMLQSIGLQRDRIEWLNWIQLMSHIINKFIWEGKIEQNDVASGGKGHWLMSEYAKIKKKEEERKIFLKA